MKTPETAWHVEETHWGEDRVRLSLNPADDGVLANVWVKSAHAVAFSGADVLLVREGQATWHFPGGRLEGGETPAQALARELREEAGATLKPSPCVFAAIRVEFPDRKPRVRGDSFTAYYLAELASLAPEYAGDAAATDPQITGRALMPISDADRCLSPLNRRLLAEARRRHSNSG